MVTTTRILRILRILNYLRDWETVVFTVYGKNVALLVN